MLKSLYAVCESINVENRGSINISESYYSVDPFDLVREKENSNSRTHVTAYFPERSLVSFEIINDARSGSARELKVHHKAKSLGMSIFILAKEMLSHSRGFLALNNKYKTPFDKTYVDILTNVELPETREVSGLNKNLLETISQIIEGEVVHENGAFYIVKSDGMKIEFPIEAEGLRKFGLLWRLIRNGLLEKGTILKRISILN